MKKPRLPQMSLHLAFGLISVLVFGLFGYHFGTGWPPVLSTLAGVVLGVLVYPLLYGILLGLGYLFNRLPRSFNASLLSILATMVVVRWAGLRLPDIVYYPAALLLVLLTLLLVLSWHRSRSKRGRWALLGVIIALAGLAWGVHWLLAEGKDPYADEWPPPAIPEKLMTLSEVGLSDPAAAGIFSVDHFTYGSGTDRRREEYAGGIRFQTPTVDASRLLPEWRGKKKKWRERYWGFGVDSFPLNAHVFLPEGEGPFPLALIVHGNHSMIDYSDGGYAYLGEILASRGIILVSVDENFINGHWSGDFRGREMPTRAWLLLKHLEQWQSWNEDAQHELFGRIDMDNIMLLGHSRGGEAVSIAAAFNQLPAYPDNALVRFDFAFSIKAVVSIAPTDYRYHRPIKLENVNYLFLQGAYDADEVSFWGLRPYRRLQFTDGGDWIKAGVYLHRANHGQFNSSWGRADFGGTMRWVLNTAPLVSGEEQRQAAVVFISAFAEASLRGNRAYLPLFEDARLAGDWLPPNYYLTHFQQNGDRILQDFEEDYVLLTGRDSLEVQATNLAIWREDNLGTRDRGSQQNHALILGWHYKDEVPDADSLATYALLLPDSSQFELPDSATHLLITLGAGDQRELERLIDKEADDKLDCSTLDLSIELMCWDSTNYRLQVSDHKPITEPLRSRFTKLEALDGDMIGKAWEVQLQTYALPLDTFDARQVQQMKLILDRSPCGVLVVDDIGFGQRATRE